MKFRPILFAYDKEVAMTLRHMNIFCAVCENNCSTTRAAAALNMTQPAVSLAIKELEQYYGVVLFDRLGKRLSISETGRRFYEYATHINTLFHDLELTLKNSEKTGLIRVGASISIGAHFLPTYIRSFGESHPDIKIKVYIEPSEMIEERILSSDLDFALTEGLVFNSDIIFEEYMEDSLKVVCSKESDFFNGQTISLDEFKAQPFLLRESKSASRGLLDAVIKQAGIAITPAWESFSTIAIINGVISNLGIAALPGRFVRSYIDDGSLKELHVEGLSFNRTFKVIYHKDKFLTPSVRAFIELCKNHPVNTSAD